MESTPEAFLGLHGPPGASTACPAPRTHFPQASTTGALTVSPPCVPRPPQAVKKFENRKMTDVLFLILYGGFWVGMFVVCGVAFSRGGVDRLYYDTDAYGFMCGINNQGSSLARAAPIGAPNNTTDYYPDFSGAKKSYLLDQFDWFGATTLVTGRKVCVEACPSAADPATLCVSKDNEDKWKPSCTSTADATDKNMTCPYARYADYDLAGKQLLPASYGRDQEDQWRTDYYPKISADNGGSTVDENTLKLQSLVWGSGPCYPNWLPNVDTLNRCLPDITSVNIADIAKEVASSTVWNSAVEGSLSTDFLETAVGDLMKGMLIIFVAGIIVAAILAGLWMVVLRYMAGLFVWAVVLLLNALTIAVTIYCALKADMISGGTSECHVRPRAPPAPPVPRGPANPPRPPRPPFRSGRGAVPGPRGARSVEGVHVDRGGVHRRPLPLHPCYDPPHQDRHRHPQGGVQRRRRRAHGDVVAHHARALRGGVPRVLDLRHGVPLLGRRHQD